eukprot:scaffold19363_cov67-Phaeocystis_antarctica.AAC.2
MCRGSSVESSKKKGGGHARRAARPRTWLRSGLGLGLELELGLGVRTQIKVGVKVGASSAARPRTDTSKRPPASSSPPPSSPPSSPSAVSAGACESASPSPPAPWAAPLAPPPPAAPAPSPSPASRPLPDGAAPRFAGLEEPALRLAAGPAGCGAAEPSASLVPAPAAAAIRSSSSAASLREAREGEPPVPQPPGATGRPSRLESLGACVSSHDWTERPAGCGSSSSGVSRTSSRLSLLSPRRAWPKAACSALPPTPSRLPPSSSACSRGTWRRWSRPERIELSVTSSERQPRAADGRVDDPIVRRTQDAQRLESADPIKARERVAAQVQLAEHVGTRQCQTHAHGSKLEAWCAQVNGDGIGAEGAVGQQHQLLSPSDAVAWRVPMAGSPFLGDESRCARALTVEIHGNRSPQPDSPMSSSVYALLLYIVVRGGYALRASPSASGRCAAPSH